MLNQLPDLLGEQLQALPIDQFEIPAHCIVR
jgi:hypothetical protein